MNDPMYRFLDRETTVIEGLLKSIRKNLNELKNLAEGKVQATNVLRLLAKDVFADIVPPQWMKYTVINMGLNDWISDLKKRLDQFQRLSETPNYCTPKLLTSQNKQEYGLEDCYSQKPS